MDLESRGDVLRIRAIGETEYLTLHTDFDLFCVCVIYRPPRRPSTQHYPDPAEGLCPEKCGRGSGRK